MRLEAVEAFERELARGEPLPRLREAVLVLVRSVRRDALAEAAEVAERRADRLLDRDAKAEARRIGRQLRPRARKSG